tara:strand:- start:2223 stop:2708 length:486 start_codon:yes stop_codon:yes gene_type:complete
MTWEDVLKRPKKVLSGSILPTLGKKGIESSESAAYFVLDKLTENAFAQDSGDVEYIARLGDYMEIINEFNEKYGLTDEELPVFKKIAETYYQSIIDAKKKAKQQIMDMDWINTWPSDKYYDREAERKEKDNRMAGNVGANLGSRGLIDRAKRNLQEEKRTR